MSSRVLLLFCLLAPVAHAQVGGRVTVGTFATRPTTCSAGDLYVTSDTNLIYQCGPANTWTMAPNLNAANAFAGNNTHIGTETFANINGVVTVDGTKYAMTDTGIQAAATALCANAPVGGTLYLPTGNYAISTGNILIACPMSIVGSGYGTNLNVISSISSTSDVFVVNPTSNGDFIHFSDFSINNAGSNGRYGIHLNGASAVIQHITIERVLINQMGSYGIYAEGSGAGEGTPRLLNVDKSTVFGGFVCTNCGDTVRLLNSEFIGVGKIDFLGFQPGSSTPIVDKDNITLTGGVHFGPGTVGCVFTNNEEETVNFTGGNWTGSNGAMLDLDGSSSAPIQDCKVVGNSFQTPLTGIAITAVRVNYANSANIHDNRIGRGVFSCSQDFNWTGKQNTPMLGWNELCGTLGTCTLVNSGSTFNISGAGACATLINLAGNNYSGTIKCTGVTGASTITITPGTNAPDGWNCKGSTDLTTPANLLAQSASSTTSCTLSGTVNTNDVLTWVSVAF